MGVTFCPRGGSRRVTLDSRSKDPLTAPYKKFINRGERRGEHSPLVDKVAPYQGVTHVKNWPLNNNCPCTYNTLKFVAMRDSISDRLLLRSFITSPGTPFSTFGLN
jgi:hypothetical protein